MYSKDFLRELSESSGKFDERKERLRNAVKEIEKSKKDISGKILWLIEFREEIANLTKKCNTGTDIITIFQQRHYRKRMGLIN